MISMFISELLGAVLQVVLFALIPFIVWLITARKTEKLLPWLGIKKPVPEEPAAKAWCIAAGAAVVYSIVMLLLLKFVFAGGVANSVSENFKGKGAAAIPAILVYSFIRTGLSEELLFRGFLYKLLNKKFSFAAANTIQALLFGALHGVPIFLATNNILSLILLTLLPACMGWVMGWIDHKKNDGSVIPSWILHGTVNLISQLFTI